MFLHGGWLHIIGNMWTLWIFGDNVEDRMGTTALLDASTLFAAWPRDWCIILPTLTPPSRPWELPARLPECSGAYFLLFPNSRVITLIPLFFLPLFVEVPAITYLGFWVLSQIFSGVLSLGLPEDVGGVAFWAHVGGFIAGAALHWLFVKDRQKRFRGPGAG